jgi:hypothetical protein
MRNTLAAVAAAACLVLSPFALAGTAQAATQPVMSGCTSYTVVWTSTGPKLVPTTTGCTTSSTGTGGTSGGGTSGTSTPGTTTNNCNTGCTATATGTGGRTR